MVANDHSVLAETFDTALIVNYLTLICGYPSFRTLAATQFDARQDPSKYDTDEGDDAHVRERVPRAVACWVLIRVELWGGEGIICRCQN